MEGILGFLTSSTDSIDELLSLLHQYALGIHLQQQDWDAGHLPTSRIIGIEAETFEEEYSIRLVQAASDEE